MVVFQMKLFSEAFKALKTKHENIRADIRSVVILKTTKPRPTPLVIVSQPCTQCVQQLSEIF